MQGPTQVNVLQHNSTSLPPKKKKALKNQTPAQEPNCNNLRSTNR